MDEHEITAAYERLTDAAAPPPGVREHVAARVARRRRRRTTSAVVAVVLVVGGTAGAAAALRGDPAERTGPVADPSPTAPAIPIALTCPSGERSSGSPGFTPGPPEVQRDLDDIGGPLLVESDEHRVLDASGLRLWVVRRDGTARAVVPLERKDGGWTWDGSFEMCGEGGPALPILPSLAADLTCGDDTVVTGTITGSSAGWPSEEEATAPWRGPDDLLHADGPAGDGTVDITIVDPDDRARVALRVDLEGDGLWHVSALAACASQVPGLPVADADLDLVALTVGHCWVAPLIVDGRTWELRDEDQFGSGGGQPAGFRGIGTMTVDEDRATYVDAHGTRLELVPADSPGTDANQGICD